MFCFMRNSLLMNVGQNWHNNGQKGVEIWNLRNEPQMARKMHRKMMVTLKFEGRFWQDFFNNSIQFCGNVVVANKWFGLYFSHCLSKCLTDRLILVVYKEGNCTHQQEKCSREGEVGRSFNSVSRLRTFQSNTSNLLHLKRKDFSHMKRNFLKSVRIKVSNHQLWKCSLINHFNENICCHNRILGWCLTYGFIKHMSWKYHGNSYNMECCDPPKKRTQTLNPISYGAKQSNILMAYWSNFTICCNF